MKHRHWLHAAVAAAAMVLVTSCMSDGGTGASATDPVTLRMTIWTSNEQHLDLLNGIAERYAKQAPAVAGVEFESRAPEEYTTALTTQLGGGKPPDLGWILEDSAKQFVSSGALADIGPALREDSGYAFDDITGSALELWTDDDAVYAYPFSTSPFGIFYNADQFADAGVPTPDELIKQGDWNWQKLAEVGEKIVSAKAAKAGFVLRDFNYTGWNRLAEVWRGFGASAWSGDGTKCRFDQPEMVAAMSFFHDMVFDRNVHPAPGTSADFFAGEAAMSATQISRAALLDDADFEWGLVPLPSGPAGDAAVIGQAGIAVFSASPNRKAATGFLKFMTNEENSAKLARFFPPARKSQLTAKQLAEANPLLSKEQLQKVVIDGIKNGETLPSHRNAAQLNDTVRAELDALWTSDANVKRVLSKVCSAAKPLLTES